MLFSQLPAFLPLWEQQSWALDKNSCWFFGWINSSSQKQRKTDALLDPSSVENHFLPSICISHYSITGKCWQAIYHQSNRIPCLSVYTLILQYVRNNQIDWYKTADLKVLYRTSNGFSRCCENKECLHIWVRVKAVFHMSVGAFELLWVIWWVTDVALPCGIFTLLFINSISAACGWKWNAADAHLLTAGRAILSVSILKAK